jgi:transcriptional regulator with PAS, ATPase and Fis domain
MRALLETVDRVAQANCPVLIEGESGTGKELVARRIHAMSRRSGKAFVPVNCAGISEALFESQFFGHVRGAFTGAQQEMLGLVRAANEGTLFLDEIGEIPLALQPKLLRVFQEGEILPVGTTRPVYVRTRFVLATNRSLAGEVEAGRFREDLYYRLDVVRIRIPPLRRRPEDIEPLLDHFMSLCSERYARPVIHLDSATRRRLEEYSWPGNVRQLSAWVERLYATGLDPRVLVGALQEDRQGDRAASGTYRGVCSLAQAERQAILSALDYSRNCISEAASVLKIHRSTLYRKLVHHRIPLEDLRG